MPGPSAFVEAMEALDAGLHVMLQLHEACDEAQVIKDAAAAGVGGGGQLVAEAAGEVVLVVGDDDAPEPVGAAGHLVAVLAVRGERGELHEGGALVDHHVDAVAHHHLAARQVAFDRPIAARPAVDRVLLTFAQDEGVADVRDGRIVTLDFELSDSAGNLLDSSTRVGPMRYLHGAGHLLPALETAVAGLEKGEGKTVAIQSADAFGEREDARVIEVKRAQLPPDVEVGAMLATRDQQGRQIPLTVVELGDETAKLDGNHPFAGKDVVFKVTVADVENATPEELAHGHPH